jgi:acyl-CoA thioester hydrolase
MSDKLTVSAPFISSEMAIEPEWIDYNGHLNMAYYSVLFDRGSDAFYPHFGLGEEVAKTTGLSTFTADFRIRYLRELKLGDKVTCTTQIIDFDEKRLHTYQELRHMDGWLAATAEALTLHVDLSGPKVVPMAPETQARIAAIFEQHRTLPAPDAVGLALGLPPGKGRKTG